MESIRNYSQIAMSHVLFFLVLSSFCFSQPITTQTLIKNLNASGGVTTDKHGNIYVSDYGPSLVKGDFESMNVYKVDAKTGEVSIFASGFAGASGACFDNEGVFYQSNVFGGSISRVFPDGKIEHNWVKDSLSTPVGLAADQERNIYVCNCSGNTIGKVNQKGAYTTFAQSTEFKCPNGLTIDADGNLYACNFGDGKILKIDTNGNVSVFAELPILNGGPSPVGNGHLTWKNGYLFSTTIGTGEIYKIDMEGNVEHIVGKPYAFKNTDGSENVGFSKPNGIAASVTGDTLYVNVSDPSWINDPQKLHPAHLRIISGISKK